MNVSTGYELPNCIAKIDTRIGDRIFSAAIVRARAKEQPSTNSARSAAPQRRASNQKSYAISKNINNIIHNLSLKLSKHTHIYTCLFCLICITSLGHMYETMILCFMLLRDMCLPDEYGRCRPCASALPPE